ncbi:unnamed protein product (macronuclear) [Paramecium tetraurelia]|uniref:Uncharacterized protein n=1 Tax=Paramecium tetraurelia TaxID=5888 RepID=A0BLG2_PARTE|nr:uncharacterized protein GSPATT00030012001 [Paramecium tetraurelia]CAK59379.1 unnamed protein product [Paramecium tetraurelia]|eukprot:XP_001426777.1 hypothetical protein (macronuclear) [Paramecium tetraurelia strain d4-2]
MLSHIFQNICPNHNSEVVAIKLSAHKQVEDVLMCLYCLTGNAQYPVVPLNEIQKLYEAKLVFIKQLQVEKHQLIKAYLNKIIDTLSQLKNDLNVQLDKGIELLENQLEYENLRLQREQNNQEDQEQTLEYYLQFIVSCESSYGQQHRGEDEFSWIQSLSKELQKLSKLQEIQDCLLISKDLKKQYQIKDQNLKSQNQIKKLLQTISQKKFNERTPNLNFNCQVHGKEIILFDMNHQTEKQKRLCCIECMPSSYISLTKAQEKLKQFETRRSNYFQQQILDKEQQYEQVQEQIIKIENQIVEQIKNLRVNFEDNILAMKQKIVLSLNSNNYDIQNLNYSELQERIDIISKSEENQQCIIFQEYQEIQNSILSQLKEQLQQLYQYQQNLYDNLRSTLCNSQEISKATSQSDQQTHNINYFIIENRETSNSNQLELLTQKSQESQDYKSSNQTQKEFNLLTLSTINENRQTRSASAQVKSKIQETEKQKDDENQIELYQENNYELIEKFKWEQNCHAISFNQDNSLMISGCQNDITVWEFNNGKIKKKQQLTGHTNLVISLFFSLSKPEFISGSTDKSIRYWQFVENQWTCTQMLLGHKRQIDCLLFDNKGDQIISCSCDKSIRVWRKNEQLKWIQVQVLTDHQAYVRCISFSKSQELFVSCGEDKLIIIWEIDEFKEWKSKQIIKNSDYGYRICFVQNNLLIWQPRNINQSIIFQLNDNLNQFEQSTQNIQLLLSNNGYQNFFPSLYNENKQIVINKHGRYVYVLKKLINDQFSISQVIEVGHYCNYGSLSPNGEYLVIWDEGSKYFQIRKAKF